jgi:hypothetical protein
VLVLCRRLSSLLIVAALGACSIQPVPVSEHALKDAYQKAIVDAQDAEPGEVDTDLIWISPANPKLLWSPGRDRVLVVTWTSWGGYDEAVGRETRLGPEVWVTAVPELRSHCSAIPTSSHLVLRMEQLLGLPPRNGKTKLVQLWADPRDLFRPAPDPEISDREAELNISTSPRAAVSARHAAWLTDKEKESYGSEGYPWTRLGYTYDWADPASERGLSEFVIEKGALVGVEGVYTAEQYCLRSRS